MKTNKIEAAVREVEPAKYVLELNEMELAALCVVFGVLNDEDFMEVNRDSKHYRKDMPERMSYDLYVGMSDLLGE